MPRELDGRIYYGTAEACKIAGVSKNTLLRWIREKVMVDVEHRDRRGWRLFTEDDLHRLKMEVNKVNRARS